MSTAIVSWYLFIGAQLGQCSNTPPSTTRIGTEIKEKVMIEGLSIKAIPNPSAAAFSLRLGSSDINHKARLIIYNVWGKVVEQREVTPNTTVHIGSKYINGLYFAELIQGKNKVTVKLIKIQQ